MKILCILTSIFLLTTACSPIHNSNEISEDGSLQNSVQNFKKLSMHLRGVPPSSKEIKALLQAEDPKQYINLSIDDYLSSPFFIQKMTNYMDELFKTAVVTTPIDKQVKGRNKNKYETSNALNNLFIDIVKNNLSWDQLITSTKYLAYGQDSRPDSSIVSDYRYFRDIFPNKIPSDYSRKNKKYDGDTIELSANSYEQQAILAGAITTARFFRRFPTTPSNANRRRAAEVYRVFLCDDMSLTVKPSEEADLELAKAALNIDQKAVTAGSHGTAKSCTGCHYKLEPVASLFMPYKKYLKPKVGTGALKFARGPKIVSINIKNGLNQLGQEIVKQEEYVSCQVKHFWSWFIGKDVPLPDKKIKHLSKKFNEFERRPKDFVKYLVLSEEFDSHYFKNFEEETSYSQIYSNVFKRCVECHAQEAPEVMTSLDFNGLSTADLISGLKTLDVKNFGQSNFDPSMPPALYSWKSRNKNYNQLIKWVSIGAPNKNNKNLLTKPQINKILRPIQLEKVKQPERISSNNFFANLHYRIMRNHDWYLTLEKVFEGHSSADISESCQQPSLEKSGARRLDLGFHLYREGQPANRNINTGLIGWLSNCARQFVNSISSRHPEALFPQTSTFGNYEILLGKTWELQNSDFKKELIEFHLISRLVTYRYLPKTRQNDIFDAILLSLNQQKNLDLKTAIIAINTMVINLPEFTNY